MSRLIRPPRRVTRTSSFAAVWGWGAYITSRLDSTVSNAWEAYGRSGGHVENALPGPDTSGVHEIRPSGARISRATAG